MLRTGEQYLDSIRDGRVIYIGDERVEDATKHPAFRDIAQTYAELYDLKAAPENRDLLSYEENGERYSMYYLRPRSKEDLERRTRAHTFINRWSYGLLGRSPDAVAGMGPAWFRNIVSELERAYPALDVEAVLDCGDAAGYALAALRSGVKIIRFSGNPSAASKIKDIAGTHGARLERNPSRILDTRGEKDADAALRRWLATK